MALVNRYNAAGVLQGVPIETTDFDIQQSGSTPEFVQLGQSRGLNAAVWFSVYAKEEDLTP